MKNTVIKPSNLFYEMSLPSPDKNRSSLNFFLPVNLFYSRLRVATYTKLTTPLLSHVPTTLFVSFYLKSTRLHVTAIFPIELRITSRYVGLTHFYHIYTLVPSYLSTCRCIRLFAPVSMKSTLHSRYSPPIAPYTRILHFVMPNAFLWRPTHRRLATPSPLVLKFLKNPNYTVTGPASVSSFSDPHTQPHPNVH